MYSCALSGIVKSSGISTATYQSIKRDEIQAAMNNQDDEDIIDENTLLDPSEDTKIPDYGELPVVSLLLFP